MGALDDTTRDKAAHMLSDLYAEFEGQFDRPRIEALMNDSLERLAGSARVTDFVPLMAYRLTRERLRAIGRSGGERDGVDVVFVSLSGGGRGQLAAALTTVLSEGRVAVHSAGTASRGTIDTGVATAISELGIDPQEAFANPVTDEVLNGADVIVTMGHSVGMIAVPEHVRHLDWRVGDPVGASITEVRRVRDDIERRVRALLDELGVVVAHAADRGSAPPL
jgi:protein-tyrosine-phosphatase